MGIELEFGLGCFEDFLMIIGWATSSSTFFSDAIKDEYILRFGCADKVGFFSN